jgi:hypothetical protein
MSGSSRARRAMGRIPSASVFHGRTSSHYPLGPVYIYPLGSSLASRVVFYCSLWGTTPLPGTSSLWAVPWA